MIKLSKIDEELNVYKDNTVVFLGYGNDSSLLLNLFTQNNLNVQYISDNNKQNITQEFGNIQFVPTSHLKTLVNNHKETGGGGELLYNSPQKILMNQQKNNCILLGLIQ